MAKKKAPAKKPAKKPAPKKKIAKKKPAKKAPPKKKPAKKAPAKKKAPPTKKKVMHALPRSAALGSSCALHSGQTSTATRSATRFTSPRALSLRARSCSPCLQHAGRSRHGCLCRQAPAKKKASSKKKASGSGAYRGRALRSGGEF